MREEESVMIAPPVIHAWFLANVEFLRNEQLLPGLVTFAGRNPFVNNTVLYMSISWTQIHYVVILTLRTCHGILVVVVQSPVFVHS